MDTGEISMEEVETDLRTNTITKKKVLVVKGKSLKEAFDYYQKLKKVK